MKKTPPKTPAPVAEPSSMEALAALCALRVVAAMSSPILWNRNENPLVSFIPDFIRYPKSIIARMKQWEPKNQESECESQLSLPKYLISKTYYSNSQLRRYFDQHPHDFQVAMQLTRQALEQRLPPDALFCASRPAQIIADYLELHDAQRSAFMLAVIVWHSEPLEAFFSNVHARAPGQAARYIAAATKTSQQDITAQLSTRSPLYRYGLLDRNICPENLNEWLTVQDSLKFALDDASATPETMTRHFVRDGLPSSLAASDFDYIAADLRYMTDLLRNGTERGEPGIHILLHGKPGTGKTELARLLATLAGSNLYEIHSDDFNGNSIDGLSRYNHLNIAFRFLKGRARSVILFDEAEDAFPQEQFAFARPLRGKRQHVVSNSKNWVNQLLETSSTPVIWTSNSISQIDPAHLRRFTYHMEVQTPPRSVRRRILDKHFHDVAVSPALLDALADLPDVTPAEAASSARFARLMDATDEKERDLRVLRRSSLSARAQGLSPPSARRDAGIPYGLEFVNLNTEYSPENMIDALKRNGSGSLCFYGPPGTGKTTLGEHIAKALNRELMVKSVSNLMSKWLGDTEKAIAQAFDEAEDMGAVLLLDEADSFLMDRRGAQRSWEITQTNEFLFRMERFNGVFICTTNLFKELDQAVLRRFDFKVGFNPLDPEQLRKLLAVSFPHPNWEEPEAAAHCRKLHDATPGDVAVIKRQVVMLQRSPDPVAVFGLLSAELAAKRMRGETQKCAIGFV